MDHRPETPTPSPSFNKEEVLRETIVALKRQCNFLQLKNRQHQSVLAAVQSLPEASTATELLNAIGAILKTTFSCEAVSFWRHPKQDTKKLSLYHSTEEASASAVSIMPDTSLMRALSGNPVLTFNIEKLPEWDRVATSSLPQGSAIIAPFSDIDYGGIIICHSNENAHFSKDDLEVLSLFAPLACQKVQNLSYRNKLQDLVEQKTRDLKQSEQRFKIFAESASDWFWETNEDHQFIYLSQNFTEKTGFSHDEIIGRTRFQLTKDIIKDEIWHDHIQTLKKRAPFRNFCYEFQMPTKGSVWFSISGTPVFDQEGTFKGYQGTGRDITEQITLRENDKKARIAAEQASLAKTEFVANISHEIRTPINGIVGTLDLLNTETIPEDQKEYLHLAYNSCKQLIAIVDDMLDISDLETGKFKLSPQECAPQKIITTVIELFQDQLTQKNLECKILYASDLPDRIKVDSGRLRQILINLLDNAIKFTPSGSITIRLDRDPRHKMGLRCQVIDTGIGIAPEQQEKIFERFTQADSSVRRQYGGTGLGLAICSEILKIMDGAIIVHSDIGKGSTFTFTFPYKPVHLPSDTETGLHPRSILVVDDILTNRLIIKSILEQEGHTVECAENANTALMLLPKKHFDLILMDIQMPGMDGFSALQEVRALPEPLCNIPTIAVTADATKAAKGSYMVKGFDNFLPKPIVKQALLTLLTKFPPVDISESER